MMQVHCLFGYLQNASHASHREKWIFLQFNLLHAMVSVVSRRLFIILWEFYNIQVSLVKQHQQILLTFFFVKTINHCNASLNCNLKKILSSLQTQLWIVLIIRICCLSLLVTLRDKMLKSCWRTRKFQLKLVLCCLSTLICCYIAIKTYLFTSFSLTQQFYNSIHKVWCLLQIMRMSLRVSCYSLSLSPFEFVHIMKPSHGCASCCVCVTFFCWT